MFRFAFLLALLAAISSVTMPFGYMPAKAEDGGFILRICDGSMAQTQLSPEHAMHSEMHHAAVDHGETSPHHADHDDTSQESRCNYAVTVAASLPDSPELEGRNETADATVPPTLAVLTAIYPPNLPPATGPPEL